jgi:hypothetical protein
MYTLKSLPVAKERINLLSMPLDSTPLSRDETSPVLKIKTKVVCMLVSLASNRKVEGNISEVDDNLCSYEI